MFACVPGVSNENVHVAPSVSAILRPVMEAAIFPTALSSFVEQPLRAKWLQKNGFEIANSYCASLWRESVLRYGVRCADYWVASQLLSKDDRNLICSCRVTGFSRGVRRGGSRV